VLNQDGSVNSFKKPAKAGSIVSIYATGEGQTRPSGVDGKVADAGNLPIPAKDVAVFISGNKCDVLYAGGVPGQVAGLLQVNVRIPADTPSGDVPVVLQVGDGSSQPGITIAVE
jgi:uncharacterized protein (TIGR03437 family)